MFILYWDGNVIPASVVTRVILPLGNQSLKGLIHNSNNQCLQCLTFPISGSSLDILNNLKQLKTPMLVTFVNLGHYL